MAGKRVPKAEWDAMSLEARKELRSTLPKKKKAGAKKKPYKRQPYRQPYRRNFNGGGGRGAQNSVIFGSGDYFSDMIGPMLKHGIPMVTKALTGFGDYSVAQNSMIPRLGGDPPIMMSTGQGGFVLRHREYIQDIYATVGFQNNVLPINPGLLSTFPLASQIADSFEQYEIKGMVFEYKSMSSDAVLSAGASSALGTIIFATQYNSLDQPFDDKRTMENYEFANSTKPSCSMLHPVECARSQTPVDLLYVRTSTGTTGDIRMYDLGQFNFAIQGCQNAAAGQVLGELWVSFEVEFFKPKLLPLGGASTLSDHYSVTGSSIIGPTNPFYTQGGLTKAPYSNLGTYIQVAPGTPYSANTIIFPPQITDGKFKIDYYIVGTAATAGNSPPVPSVTLVNCSLEPYWAGGTSGAVQIDPSPSATSNNFHFSYVISINQNIPGTRAGIGFAMTGALPQGVQLFDLVITLLNNLS